MSVDCGSCIAKYLLCLFNFTFFLLGSVVLGVGVWLAADKASFIALLKMVENEHIEQFTQPAVIEQMAYVLIVCGALMFFLSFMGYCGAIRESPCMLTTYGILMIVILVAQFTVGGLAAAYKDRARLETKNFLQSTISRYYSSTENTDAVSLMWNHLMAEMRCCGVENYKDFELSEKWKGQRDNRIVPEACCVLQRRNGYFKPQDESCPYAPSDTNSHFNSGCYEALTNWIIGHRNIIVIVGIGVTLIEIFAIFLAFCLCNSIHKYGVMRL